MSIPVQNRYHGAINTAECLKHALLEINNLIQEGAKRLIEEDARNPFHIASFDTDLFISQVNPILWDFITRHYR